MDSIADRTRTATRHDAAAVKSAARGRWVDIASSVYGIDPGYLDGKHHPCPRCGGADRWRVFGDFAETGGALCNQCFSDKNGDGLALGQWYLGIGFAEVLELVADHLGIEAGKPKSAASHKTTTKRRRGYRALPDAITGIRNWMLRKVPGRTIDKTATAWMYTDQAGREVMAVARYNTSQGKQFCPFHMLDGQWFSGDPAGKLPLFSLPTLTAADHVYVCEGEKAAEAAQELGLIATTSSHGSKSAKKTDWTPLAGKRVTILRDNDEDGKHYANEVAAILSQFIPPATVAIKLLPDLPPKGDLFDFVAAKRLMGEPDEVIAAAVEAAEIESQSSGPTRLPEVALPGGDVSITGAAGELGILLAATGRYYVRGGAIVRLRHSDNGDGQPVLQTVRPAEFCSDIETVAQPGKIVQGEGGEPEFRAATCPKGTAELLLASHALADALPHITTVTACPVLLERDGKLITLAGYDAPSGIWATGGNVPEITLDDARARLSELLADFSFATPGDRARALAALITPALVMGGLLGGRAPIDLGEADDSQAGKGYRNKLTAAIYGATVATIAQQPQGGVGSLKETFDRVLVAGKNFIALDNLRGKLDLTALESFLTEDSYIARVPYSSGVEIDPHNTIIMLTSNKAETTVDLANRSSCVRILKHPDGHEFRQWPEGDLLDHVRANPSHYLAAVFAIVREWHRRGKPRGSNVGHDFRRWASTLRYIVGDILGAGDLLDGHREAQGRLSNPRMTWLRSLALAVRAAGLEGQWLRAHDLLRIVSDAEIETRGITQGADLDDGDSWKHATKVIGMQMAAAFKGDSVTVDGMLVERERRVDQSYREKTEYRFSSRTPNSPNSPPTLPPTFLREPPTPPTTFQHFHGANHIHSSGGSEGVHGCSRKVPDPLGGLGGVGGKLGVEPQNEIPTLPELPNPPSVADSVTTATPGGPTSDWGSV